MPDARAFPDSMKRYQTTIRLGFVGHALAGSVSASALPITIDDFGGGPHVVALTSTSPPEIATSAGGFAYAGAVGGNRDAAVWSTTAGAFAAGVSFNAGGYASFAGRGEGVVVWDGVPGISDANANNQIDIAEVDLGLTLDILDDCVDPQINVSAFADLPGAVLDLIFLTDHANFAVYSIALIPGSFNDYSISVLAPTSTTGVFDPTDVKAVAMFVDGSALADLDVRVNKFTVTCVPDGGATVALMGIGLLGLVAVHRRLSR